MASVLVIGGAGLIGGFLLKDLVAAGHVVTLVDDLSRGQTKHIPPEVTFIKARAEDLPLLHFGGFDVIFHLASFMFGLGFSAKNHALLYDKNTAISDAFLTFLKTQTPVCRVVYISSSCVYSDDGPDCVDEATPLGALPEIANIGYGFSKRHMEDRLQLAAHLQGFTLSLVRPLNIYGETYRWAGEYSQAIPMLVDKVMRETQIDVWGSGAQQRCYVHASDCAALLMKVAFCPRPPALLNIGHEQTISLNALTLLIARLAKRDITIINNLTKPEGRRVKSCSRALTAHYFPDFNYKVPLEDGLLRMIGWWGNEVKS